MIIEKENQFPIKNHNIKAILGPTNTGKTYFAIDRMLSYSSGIIELGEEVSLIKKGDLFEFYDFKSLF